MLRGAWCVVCCVNDERCVEVQCSTERLRLSLFGSIVAGLRGSIVFYIVIVNNKRVIIVGCAVRRCAVQCRAFSRHLHR